MITLLEAVVVLAIAVAIVALAVAAVGALTARRTPELEPAGPWHPVHHSVAGVTKVGVARGLGRARDERVIAEIDDRDPEYDARFLAAMAEARNRAALLNAEDDVSGS